MKSLNSLSVQHKKVKAAADNARNANMLTAKDAATKLADEVAVLLETKIQCLYEINERLKKLEGVNL